MIEVDAIEGGYAGSRVLFGVSLTVQAGDLRTTRRGGGKPVKGNSVYACLQEKSTRGCRERPYRKPTLVAGHKCAKVDE